MQINLFVISLKVDARARVLLSNKEKNLAKKILLNIHLKMTSNQLAPIHESTTCIVFNKELSMASDSSIIKEDVIEVSEIVPAQSAPSDFKAYLSSLDENHAFSDPDSAYSELITSKFNDTLCTVEKLRRIKSSSAWDIIRNIKV